MATQHLHEVEAEAVVEIVEDFEETIEETAQEIEATETIEKEVILIDNFIKQINHL